MSFSLELCSWGSGALNSEIIERPSLADLEDALVRMSGHAPLDLVLTRGRSCAIAGGHDGRFVVIITRNDGAENWHAETGAPIRQDRLPKLVVGGKGGDYAAALRVTFEEMCIAMRHFAQSGGFSPSLRWVED